MRRNAVGRKEERYTKEREKKLDKKREEGGQKDLPNYSDYTDSLARRKRFAN